MTTAAFVLGFRGLDEFGAFVAPDDIDALVGTPEQLLLHITSATAQIAMRGIISSPFGVVPHLLGYAPIVIPNLKSSVTSGATGYVRPWPNGPTVINSTVKSEPTQLTFAQTGSALDINYFVLNRPAP